MASKNSSFNLRIAVLNYDMLGIREVYAFLRDICHTSLHANDIKDKIRKRLNYTNDLLEVEVMVIKNLKLRETLAKIKNGFYNAETNPVRIKMIAPGGGVLEPYCNAIAPVTSDNKETSQNMVTTKKSISKPAINNEMLSKIIETGKKYSSEYPAHIAAERAIDQVFMHEKMPTKLWATYKEMAMRRINEWLKRETKEKSDKNEALDIIAEDSKEKKYRDMSKLANIRNDYLAEDLETKKAITEEDYYEAISSGKRV